MAVIAATRDFIIETPYVQAVPAWQSGPYSAWAWAHGPALAQTCPDDLAALTRWFRPSGARFGPDNPVHVVIEAFPPAAPTGPPAPGGQNWGYKTRGATKIQIAPLVSAPNPDEAMRAIFVHELSEILMTAQYPPNPPQDPPYPADPRRWIPSNSMGEALADVCGWVRCPDAFGPLVGNWLNYQATVLPAVGRAGIFKDWHRPNWIDNTDNKTPGGGQLNAPAVGCGILFIHYLRWLGFSIEEIIANGAPTFRQLLDQVTKGRDIGGSQAFFDLINLHFPEMPDPQYQVTTDDLFPLPSLVRMTLDRPSATGPDKLGGTVELDAPQKATLVTLLSSRPDLAIVPSTVTIPLNSTKGTFTVFVPYRPDAIPLPTVLPVQILASYAGNSVGSTLTLHSPLESDTGVLKSVTVGPRTIVAGAESTCTVELERAVSTDTVVGLAALASGGGPGLPHGPQSDLVTIRSRIPIPARTPSAQFQILTSPDVLPPRTAQTVTIVANAIETRTATLTIEGG
jgi:hypothetical protein